MAELFGGTISRSLLDVDTTSLDADHYIAAGDDFTHTFETAGDIDAAKRGLECYDAAIKLDGKDVEAWYSKGKLLELMKQYSFASKVYVQLCEMEPDDGDYYNTLGTALFMDEQFDAAATAYLRAAVVYKANGASIASIVAQHVCRAQALRRGGGAAASLQAYDDALELDSNDEDALKGKMEAEAAAYWREVAAAPVDEIVLLPPPYQTLTLDGSTDNPLHSVHCMHWLDTDECARLVAAVELHCSSPNVSGWSGRRHQHHSTQDVEVSSIPALAQWASPYVYTSLIPTLAGLFRVSRLRLRLRELFVVKYSSGPGQPSNHQILIPATGVLSPELPPLLFNPTKICYESDETCFPCICSCALALCLCSNAFS
jgi:tetratricopeptide (TPR) repeat protein